MFVVIPKELDDQIEKDLEMLRDTLPENERAKFEAEFDIHRQRIIEYYHEFGKYPEIGGVEKTVDKSKD